ncbi:MAG: DUF2339 domain-containing protein [Pseudomonadota bacterium]
MTGFTLLLLGLMGLALLAMWRRVVGLEDELGRFEDMFARLEGQLFGSGEPSRPQAAEAAPAIAAAVAVVEPEAEPKPVAATEPVAEPAPEPRLTLESLVGGKLPIWIGGAALVLAGFFLVRYSIENGLLGPAARTILAAFFAAALIAGSEVTRRLPATSDDPRVAQALAGAGTASFYATLYMAAQIYHLVSSPAAFVLMLLVTALAMALSLRHGPPTAVMALIGGFVAPLIAGFDAAGIGPLLVYLGLFVAALFGLAVHRGWGWLALAATGAGFAWINFLVTMLRGDDLAAVGGFVVVLAVGASAALPATGARAPWLRLAPLLAGLIQLLALAPVLDFSPLAWSFYLVLAAATLFLAWRDRVFLPGALAALALLLVLEMLGLTQAGSNATQLAAIAATLVFAVPGHLLARRAQAWAVLAIGGTAGPLLVAHAAASGLMSDSAWAALELLAAALCASLAWRTRSDEAEAPVLVAATSAAALLAAVGLALLFPHDWVALPLSLVMLALAGWARLVKVPALFVLPAFPLAAALAAALMPLLGYAWLIGASLSGDPLPYALLPGLADVLRSLAIPVAAAIALLLTDSRQFGRPRRAIAVGAIILGVLILYTLAKQLLAIGTPERFLAWGFVERAILTQACLAAGWVLLRRTRFATAGFAFLTLGLLRFGWFDLLVLNPLIVPQWAGIAVLHAALAAWWFHTLPSDRRTRPDLIGLAFTFVAVLVAVRQAAHGAILTGGIGSAENIGYSAALLALSLAWLWRGIATRSRVLRIAGLALLTLVTLKVFLVDAAALDGILRILSFLGLGIALIGIGWAYSRFVGKD